MTRYNVPADMPDTDLKQVLRRHVCAECGRGIAVFIDLRDKSQFVACKSQQHDDAGIVREWTAPKGEDTLNMEKQRRIDMVTEQHGQGVSTALAAKGLPMSGTLTEAQATTVLKTIWKDAPDIEVWKAAKVCQDFGLHPLLKHLYLIEYGNTWTMVLGIGATRLMMSRRGAFGYTDNTPRIMTEQEQKDIFGAVDKENIVAITRLRTATGLEAQGYGKYPKAGGHFQGAGMGNTRQNMAFIRSERNAFGRLNPDALPQGVDVVDERFVETPSGTVDTETGELPADGEFREVSGEITPEDLPFTEPPAGDIGEKPEPAEKPKRAAKAATPPADTTPVSDEQLTTIRNQVTEAGLEMKDIGAEFIVSRAWKITKLEEMTSFQAELVKDWLADKIQEKAAAK